MLLRCNDSTVGERYNRHIFPSPEAERAGGDRCHGRHKTEELHLPHHNCIGKGNACYSLHKHHRRPGSSAWRGADHDGQRHLEAHHPWARLQPHHHHERGRAPGGTAMGRRARHRGGCSGRQLGGDPEGACLTDVRLGCHGWCSHPAQCSHTGRRRDEGQRELRVSDQQRTLRLLTELRWPPEQFRMGCPFLEQDGPCL